MSHPSDRNAEQFVDALAREVTGASRVKRVEPVQTLWGGYGQLVRCHLEGADVPSVIVKHVRWPTAQNHPRGWNSDRSHRRKVRSYEVESQWYDAHAASCRVGCRVPRGLAVRTRDDGVALVLEDLDPAGFPHRKTDVGQREIEVCLRWLAEFHATFMGRSADGLWPVGTYWHLDTRPDELAVLKDGPLKRGAAEIDRRLTETPHRTFVHGDAKLANFCFSADGQGVAAVDFQYVGGGCGMKDVAYFISSCLYEDEAERAEARLLDVYFQQLAAALDARRSSLDFAALEREWRDLYPVAWTDFYRFLQGWSPGHWKIHRYSERLAREVLATL